MRKLLSTNGLGMFLLGVTLALGFTLSAQTLSQALVKMRQDNTIKVKGYAEQEVTSDFATWGCRIVARSANLAEAYVLLEKAREATRSHILQSGIAEKELEILPVSTNVGYARDKDGTKTNTIEVYILYQNFAVKTAGVDKVNSVSKSITELIKQNIEIESYSPQYVDSGIDKVKMSLLAAATDNAYARARILAENSGGRVGPLCSASQGVFQITPVHSTEVSDYGTYDTSTVTKSVRAVVTLEFTIEKKN